MLTDAFEKQRNPGIRLSDTLSDALKDYPAHPRTQRSRSILPRLQCFLPSSSKDNPNRTQLRKQLSEAQTQYQELHDQSRHAETALSGSVSDTLRLDRDKKLAEAQAEQAAREVQQLQRALQESEARAAAVSQRVQQDVQLLTLHVKELANQAHRVSTQLGTARGDSISRLMETAWEGGTEVKPTDSFEVSDVLANLQDLHVDLDRAQQQVSLLESSMKGRVLADWQTQQDLQAELLSLQSQQWWAPQLAKGSVGLGCAYIGGVWWVTKGMTRVCLIPASIVQRVFDIAKRDHQSIVQAPNSQVSISLCFQHKAFAEGQVALMRPHSSSDICLAAACYWSPPDSSYHR